MKMIVSLTLALACSFLLAAVFASAISTRHTAPIVVTATMTEYNITLSPSRVPAGYVDFLVTNKGKTGHSLTVKGPGVMTSLPAVLNPGESATLHVLNMQPGTYMVYCPIDNHAALGMKATFTVM